MFQLFDTDENNDWTVSSYSCSIHGEPPSRRGPGVLD